MATVPAPDDDVEKLLTGIMAKQSPLMKQARTQGIQGAQNAGLGQSTMGIKAAQAAAYNAALPIASQQAQQRHQKGMQTSQFGHETGMQTSQFGHETGMQTAGFQHAANQAQLDRDSQATNLDRSAYLDRIKMHEELGVRLPFEAQQRQQDRAQQDRLAAMEMSSRNREIALNATTQMNQAFSQAYAQTAQNHELPPEVRNGILAHLENVRRHNEALSSATFRYDVPW